MTRALLLALALLAAALPPAAAQNPVDGPLELQIERGEAEPLVLAMPPFIDEGGAQDLAGPLREVAAADLAASGLIREWRDEAGTTPAPVTDFDAPVDWAGWRVRGVQALLVGAASVVDGHIFLRFRLYDIGAGRPSGEGVQLDAAPAGARRVSHKLADIALARLTGEAGAFDSRIAIVAESGPKTRRIKRLALIDADGGNLRFLTDGADLVLTPRFSPDGRRLAYVTFRGGTPRIATFDLGTMQGALLPGQAPRSMSFAPRFSPDGRTLVHSLEKGGNTDIWQYDLATGLGRPLVEGPGIDTAPSLSPDGTQLVFESDRSGSSQLYVMAAAGGEAQRISFGAGARYNAPAWSPRGDLIAFTIRKDGVARVGVMAPDGTGEQLLTDGPEDQGPSWSPNGTAVIFTRQQGGAKGAAALHAVDIGGRNVRAIAVNYPASDPDWGPLLP